MEVSMDISIIIIEATIACYDVDIVWWYSMMMILINDNGSYDSTDIDGDDDCHDDIVW